MTAGEVVAEEHHHDTGEEACRRRPADPRTARVGARVLTVGRHDRAPFTSRCQGSPAVVLIRRSSRGLSGRVRTDGSTASDGVAARGAHACGERADDEAAQGRRGSRRPPELSLRISSRRSPATGRRGVRTSTLRGAGVELAPPAGRGMQRPGRLLGPVVADHDGRRLIGARFIHPFGVRPHWWFSFRCSATRRTQAA
jgi:hypothetical protein